MDYTIYDVATGRVIRVGQTGETDFSFKAQSGEATIAGHADAATQYVSGGLIAARPAPDMSALSSVVAGAEVTITGIAEGAVVTATPENGSEQTDTVDSSEEMDITFTTAGVYTVKVSEVFPAQSAVIEVEVS